MEIFWICLVAFLAAILTFFSGFGLGTMLTPVFMLFFPVEMAIALTGVVHFFNNIFKLFLVGKNAVKRVVVKFGIPSIIGAFIGAWVLLNIPDSKALFAYQLGDSQFEVFPVKFIIAIILLIFAILDLIPAFNKLQFSEDKLPMGGFLSGFFGGLSGNQGALRSAFLIKANLSKTAFIGTAVIVSTLVDFTRLGVYSTKFLDSGLSEQWGLIISATLSAISGAYIGNSLLKKVTLRFVQIFVAIMLIIISVALALGWV